MFKRNELLPEDIIILKDRMCDYFTQEGIIDKTIQEPKKHKWLRLCGIKKKYFENIRNKRLNYLDENGKKRKDFNTNSTDDREAYRSHYTPFHRLVFNLKKIMAKAPGGSSVVARYGAALRDPCLC